MNYQTNFSILSNWRAMTDLRYEIKVKNDKIS